jgi:hypothetical protein
MEKAQLHCAGNAPALTTVPPDAAIATRPVIDPPA